MKKDAVGQLIKMLKRERTGRDKRTVSNELKRKEVDDGGAEQ